MSSITFGGLASGLDTNAIIDGLLAAEKVPLTHLQTQQSQVNAAKDTISSISAKLGTLKTAALALGTPGGYSSFKSSSSSTSVVATVTGGASASSIDMTVTALAKEQRTYASPVASSVDDLNMFGQLSIQVGSGTAAVIDVAATDSLTDIAAKISSSGARVMASVIYDGSNYRLQVRGLDTGEANAVTFNESGFTLGLNEPGATVQGAQDAAMVIDGISIKRSTNQVVGVIPGVTLALTKVSTDPVTINVEADNDALTKKLQAFATAYNDVVSLGQSAAGFGSLKAANPKLAGDSTIRATLDAISKQLGLTVPGTSGKYTTLGSIGFAADKDGKLKLDDVKLKAAISADPTAVSKLFVEDASVGSTGAMKGLGAAIDRLATNSDALLKSRIESLGKTSARMDEEAESIQRRLDLFETNMRQRFTALETLVSQWNAKGSQLSGLNSSD